MSKTFHKSVRLRALAGMINNSDEIFTPVFFHSDEEKGFAWVPLTKVAAKEIIQAAEEGGLEEVQGVTIEEEDGVKTLYFDGPDAEEGDGEEEEETPGEEEGS
jgi:hypothetical protein